MPMRRSRFRRRRHTFGFKKRSNRMRRRRFTQPRRRRRPRVSRRRVLNITTQKKRDVQLSSSIDQVAPSITELNIGANYFLWAPSWIAQRTANDKISKFRRERQTIFFRGIQERIFVSPRTPMTWRRVVFTCYERFPTATPFVEANPTSGNNYQRRPFRPFEPQTGGADAALGEHLWAGQVGVDFSEETRMFHKLDKNYVKVLSDTSIDLNTNFQRTLDDVKTFGKHVTKKLWHPINMNLTYAMKESGDDWGNFAELDSHPWVVTAPTSGGNVYIMDILHTGGGIIDTPGTDIAGSLKSEATVYWHER